VIRSGLSVDVFAGRPSEAAPRMRRPRKAIVRTRNRLTERWCFANLGNWGATTAVAPALSGGFGRRRPPEPPHLPRAARSRRLQRPLRHLRVPRRLRREPCQGLRPDRRSAGDGARLRVCPGAEFRIGLVSGSSQSGWNAPSGALLLPSVLGTWGRQGVWVNVGTPAGGCFPKMGAEIAPQRIDEYWDTDRLSGNPTSLLGTYSEQESMGPRWWSAAFIERAML